MFRLLYFVPTYIFFTLFVNLPTIILGWIFIPPMALLNKYTTKQEISIINGRTILNWKHKFMFIWSNQEDGLAGASEYKDKPLWFRIVYWSALRNPSNNLRFVKSLTCQINSDKIKTVLGKATTLDGKVLAVPTLRDYDRDDLCYITLIWQGPFSNFRVQFKMFGKIWRFWVGWKVYAHDKLGISPADYRYHGAGFATQFKRIHPRVNK